MLSTSYVHTDSFNPPILWSVCSRCPYFTDEEIEAQRSYIMCPGSHSWEALVLWVYVINYCTTLLFKGEAVQRRQSLHTWFTAIYRRMRWEEPAVGAGSCLTHLLSQEPWIGNWPFSCPAPCDRWVSGFHPCFLPHKHRLCGPWIFAQLKLVFNLPTIYKTMDKSHSSLENFLTWQT